jgi:hypothetical protein
MRRPVHVQTGFDVDDVVTMTAIAVLDSKTRVSTTQRLLSHLKPYAPRLGAALLCMALFAASSGLALGLFSPFLQILFAPPDAQVSARASAGVPDTLAAAGGLAGMVGGGSWGNLDRWPAILRGPLEGFLFDRPPLEALGRLCLLIVLAFLLKNLFDYCSPSS